MKSFLPKKLSHWLNSKSTGDSEKLENIYVNLIFNIESIWLKYSSITRNPGSNFISASDSTLQVKMTPFFLSVFVQLSRKRVWITKSRASGYLPSLFPAVVWVFITQLQSQWLVHCPLSKLRQFFSSSFEEPIS